jgi:hypothetical protein
MLDYKRLSEDFTRILNSYTDEEVLEWIELDKKRMALIDEEERRASQATKLRRASAKLNGAPSKSVETFNLEPVQV